MFVVVAVAGDLRRTRLAFGGARETEAEREREK